MPTFHKRCASLLVFVDHGFERSVIPGYLPRLTRPEPILYFFRDVHGIYSITQPALRKRTQAYPPWVAAFARHHPIPLPWPEPERKKPGLRQEDYARLSGGQEGLDGFVAEKLHQQTQVGANPQQGCPGERNHQPGISSA